MKPDNELLQQYAGSHSEDAFAELVRRHVNLVYSAALRQVGGDAHLARDAAQNVFTDLARKAASLSNRESLTGWLYTSAYFAANKIVRTENRRRQREEQFMREPAHHAASQADWEQLRPALDAVMHELNETDREAVLLRYFENRAYAEVGAKLNLNENAARMRVDRALEKLRTLLAKRGITTGAALAAVISANAVQTAPVTLAPALASASLAGASAGGFTLFQTMNALKFKIGAGALAVAGAAIVLTINHSVHARPRIQNSQTQTIAQAQPVSEGASNPLLLAGDSGVISSNSVIQLPKPGPAAFHAGAAMPSPTSAQLQTNALPDTNKVIIDLKVRIVSLSEESVQTLRPAWPGGDSGVLTDDQLKFIDKALQKRSYSDTQSKITAFSGQQAIMGGPHPFQTGDTNASLETIFGVTPYFSPESSVFRLNLFVAVYSPGDGSSMPEEQMIGKTNELTLSPGQVAVLQREIPAGLLLSDSATEGAKELLVFVTPEIGEPNQETHSAPPIDPAAREAVILRINDAHSGVLALLMFASDNQGQIPPTLTQANRYLTNGVAERLEANFDVIYSGSLSNIEKPSETIVLKEKQPQQIDGSWSKAYSFADGHSEIHKEASGNFDNFENQHTIPPTANQ